MSKDTVVTIASAVGTAVLLTGCVYAGTLLAGLHLRRIRRMDQQQAAQAAQ